MNDEKTIKTRFAPSPTGYMHIGNLRTALYSYLIAKAKGGKFILRIEDTDRERFVEGATDVIFNTLKIANIDCDEGPHVGGEKGPYIQSERKEIYQQYVKILLDNHKAYRCFCSKERLNQLQEAEAVGYDRHCRNLSEEEVNGLLEQGNPYVIRQKMPLEGVTSYEDCVFGTISVENKELQDQILMKADGYPTYNFAHVVDDYLMGITHVVRGSEYISSTPKYVLLYEAFGWGRPVYVHLPLMMGTDAEGNISKLSKRHGAVSFEDLLNDGYLPEAIINYIALLGWSPKGTQEFFTIEALKESFEMNRINKSPAVFDYDKLTWFNAEYIRGCSPEKFRDIAKSYLPNDQSGQLAIEKLFHLIQPRITKLSQISEMVSFFYTYPDFSLSLFENKKNKTDQKMALDVLGKVSSYLPTIPHWTNEELFTALCTLSEQTGIKKGSMMWVVRIAVSGMSVTPGGATEILEILGPEESLKRLHIAIKRLEASC